MTFLFLILLITYCLKLVDSQVDVVSVSPGAENTVTSATSSNISPGVSRMLVTNDVVLGTPFDLEGTRVGSSGILLSWKMPDITNVDYYVIRYKEVCPYIDVNFIQVNIHVDMEPLETLINSFTSGSTYHIQVAAAYPSAIGPYSKSLYIQTNESPPGQVTNLTAHVQNHTYAIVTWFLPHRINGLITKFAIKVKHTRTAETVYEQEVNAGDIMSVALPHCNDAADILSRATLSPLEMTASAPPITLSAVPPAASWSVPISVGVDGLRPYTAYLFEVSAFTSDGEGQIASQMTRTPESAPEDPPQNFNVLDVTSRSISVSWNSPNIITGKFTYVLYIYGSTGTLYENSTSDMQFIFTGLTPYTSYTVAVRAKSAGEVGPAAEEDTTTFAEVPGAVQDLSAMAEDSVSILVSWKSPAEPNGPITQYRLLVFVEETLVQDITLTAGNTTDSYQEWTAAPDVSNSPGGRRKRSAELSVFTSTTAFTAALSAKSLPTDFTMVTHQNTDDSTRTDQEPTFGNIGSEMPATHAFSITTVQPSTFLQWLASQAPLGDRTSDSPSLDGTPSQVHISSQDARLSTRAATSNGVTVVTVREEMMTAFTEDLSYLVSELNPFTEYTFRVTASTTMGEGPIANVTEKTREQVPSSVLDVTYQNISSTTIQVNWVPPLTPNGQITHYTVYGVNLHNNQPLQWTSNTTNILITDLEKYTSYRFHVAASTAAGESFLSEEDDIFVFTLEDEPDSPPYNLTVLKTTPSTVMLTWSAPEHANGDIKQYEVLFGNESYSTVFNSSINTVTLSSLRPFSYYNVSVRAYTRYGHGNQTSDILYFLSGEDAPGSPPYGLSYNPVSPSEVNMTWEAPLLPNGVIIYYSLELWNTSHLINLTSPTNYILVTHLRKFTHYWATVQAHTRAGPGNSSELLNITTLEDAPDSPPQLLQARKLSEFEVYLSWNPPREANSVILQYNVRVWNETIELEQNVTETSLILYLDAESYYNASVSTWTRQGDGGLRSYISITTADTDPLDPPQNVSVTNVTISSITLRWRSPTEPRGLVIYYSIYYVNNYTVIEQRVFVSDMPVPVSPDFFSYTLTGLVGGFEYTLWMTSSTIDGDGGVKSEPITLILPEDVPSGPVQNLTATIYSSTTVVVSWDPPLEPNGQPYYLITLQEAGVPPDISTQGTPAVNKTIKQRTTDNVVLFTKLRKYFPYVVTVIPATSAGPAYNYTSTLNLRTDEDIPSSAPVLVSTTNLSSSSIAVVWQRPLEANGEITEYIVNLSGPTGSNSSLTSNTSVIFTYLLPYTPYNMTVTAATRKGSGLQSLLLQLHTDEDEPISPPRNLMITNYTAVSVWLSWDPPVQPNGVILQYSFRVKNLITHSVTYQNSSDSSTTAYLSGFRPHSSYEISVYSFTSVGHGNQFSTPVTFTTNESVSDPIGNLSCSGLSWNSIWLTWESPANPNGQIVYYEVRVDLGLETFEYRSPSTEYTVTGLSPDSWYTLTVSAVNSAGPGDTVNCSASTLSESAPDAPQFLIITNVTSSTMTILWAAPLSMQGLLKEYHIVTQLLSAVCETNSEQGDQANSENEISPDCVDSNFTVVLNASGSSPSTAHSITLHFLNKYRYYRIKVAAVTNAGVGEYTYWSYVRTLPGDPDAPPRNLKVTPTSRSFHIAWDAPAILSGPTSYLVQVNGPGLNMSTVRIPGEPLTIVVMNLTPFTRYRVIITAFTGPLALATTDGKAIGPNEYHTLEEEPKNPPKNVLVFNIANKVNRVKVIFSAPDEPYGNITDYFVFVYNNQQLVKNESLIVTHMENDTMIADIDGLKGGKNYSIKISAKNGVGLSPPSPDVHISTEIQAPAKPYLIPQVQRTPGGAAMVTHKTISIRLPACFYNDDNGPIVKIQVIVAELGVKDSQNVTVWKNAFLGHPAPYLTDEGFPNPACVLGLHWGTQVRTIDRRNHTNTGTYVIGEDDSCIKDNSTHNFCNGHLKPNTAYVFKFRATNTMGQFTDSEYSDHVRTKDEGLLTRDEQIILGVLLSFALAVLLITIICVAVKVHQHKMDGGTYSPREVEIIDAKYKLDQLVAVADLDIKQDNINRYSSFFFRRKEIYVIQLLSYRKSLKPISKKSFLQHVEDLCANDNAKFQEEFAALPKLLQDLATTDADLPWNKSKNRFPNIRPYNNNRVKLLSEPGTAGSDYINASFVSGYLCPNEFIATQGPLPGTVADFWRMIWETGTRTIAMLTQCFEKGKIRCHKYWPEDNKPMSVFSDILISKVSEEVFPDWSVRTLKVEKHGHYILVRHFNYTSWPEHGVPESCSTFIKFVKAVRANRHDNNTTIAVHCSAGVGRTGVFIALDHLIQHIRDHDFVDIFGLVAELRGERMCMVQNLAQYIFLHQSTLELLNNKGNSQSIWFVSYSALEKMDSLDAMEAGSLWNPVNVNCQHTADTLTNKRDTFYYEEVFPENISTPLFKAYTGQQIGDVELEWEETTM